VFCTFRVPGFHCWPDAPEHYGYLRNLHRHEFHFRIEVKVGDPDREIEFIAFKNECVNRVADAFSTEDELFDGVAVNFGGRSCEMIAVALHNVLYAVGYHDVVMIEVSEDGENGARAIWS
jgi:hypothetical protein